MGACVAGEGTLAGKVRKGEEVAAVAVQLTGRYAPWRSHDWICPTCLRYWSSHGGKVRTVA